MHQSGQHVRRQHVDREDPWVTVDGHHALVLQVCTGVVDHRIELPERVGLLRKTSNVIGIRQVADCDAGGPIGEITELDGTFGRAGVQDDLVAGVQELLSRGAAEARRGTGDEDG